VSALFSNEIRRFGTGFEVLCFRYRVSRMEQNTELGFECLNFFRYLGGPRKSFG
jgi:hypothetical protein